MGHDTAFALLLDVATKVAIATGWDADLANDFCEPFKGAAVPRITAEIDALSAQAQCLHCEVQS